LLVSADGRLIAVRTAEGAFLQQTQGGSRFTRDAWLQYWALDDFKPLPAKGEAGPIQCNDGYCLLRPYPDRKGVLLARGARHPAGCGQASIIVSAEPARGLCPHPWPKLVDRFTVWRNGSAAIWLNPKRAVVLSDRDERGDRPWVPPPPQSHRTATPARQPAANPEPEQAPPEPPPELPVTDSDGG
jgi:competence protein ComEC